MVFRLFKKKTYADLIISGGTVYTMDPELPKAKAVAISDGLILAAGSEEDLAGFAGPDTQRENLHGAFLTPGLIDLRAACAEEAAGDIFEFERVYEVPEEAEDEARAEAPDSGAESADALYPEPEEVENPDNSEEELLEAWNRAMSERHSTLASRYLQRGVTSVLSLERDRLSEFYTSFLIDRLQSESLSFRYFGSIALDKPADIRSIIAVLQGRKILCMELEGLINMDFLDIFLTSDEAAPGFMSEEYLRALCEEVASHGYGMRLNTSGKAATLIAADLAGELSESYPRAAFIVQSDEELTSEDFSKIHSGTAAMLLGEEKAFRDAETELALHTSFAAHAIGKRKRLGSIESGKAADFAVFDKDPLSAASREEFNALRAASVYLAGQRINKV